MSYAALKRSLIILLALVLALYINSSMYCNAQEPKRIALTFDDGPHYKYTGEILDILKKYDVRATFFTVGTNVERFPELVQRELSEGHEVANHTYSHKHMAKLTEAQFKDEVKGWEDVIYEGHEYTSDLFRPPEGILTDGEKQVISELGYDVVLWSIDTRDWAHNKVDRIVDAVISDVTDGAVILFHDFVSGDSPTPEALEIIIPKLKDMGYEFVTVSQLMD
ncbi:MAG: polysaccharide deacetylase family protein [Clostridia bacterium]|nr:polysaccharide deacetylase family protein [Clostridia bacterium]